MCALYIGYCEEYCQSDQTVRTLAWNTGDPDSNSGRANIFRNRFFTSSEILLIKFG